MFSSVLHFVMYRTVLKQNTKLKMAIYSNLMAPTCLIITEALYSVRCYDSGVKKLISPLPDFQVFCIFVTLVTY